MFITAEKNTNVKIIIGCLKSFEDTTDFNIDQNDFDKSSD